MLTLSLIFDFVGKLAKRGKGLTGTSSSLTILIVTNKPRHTGLDTPKHNSDSVLTKRDQNSLEVPLLLG